MASSAAPHPYGERQIDVETPEHVALGYELADLGSRFTALLIDATLIVLGSAGLSLASLLLLDAVGAAGVLRGLGVGALVLLGFVLLWGYFVLFEGLRDGQTPGKRWMGIRVVHDGGFPLTMRGAAVRNLIRVVDIQPAPSWIVGGLCMMLHPRTKRLGDLAAGTVVVRDRAAAALPGPVAGDEPGEAGAPRLNEEQFAALELYVGRRSALAPSVRASVARQLLDRLAEHLGEEASAAWDSPDAVLAAAHASESSRRAAAGAAGASGSALAAALVRRQRGAWGEYADLLDAARRAGLDRLGEQRVSRFAALYREIAADLARARTYRGSPELLRALERLVGGGHNLLYRPPHRSLARFAAFARGGFAVLVRRRWRPVALAALLLFGPGVLTFAAVRADPPFAREILPPVLVARAEDAAARERRGEGYVEIPEVAMPVMASSLIANNVQVTFLAFGGGILAGVGTLLILVLNGILLGGTVAIFAYHGQTLHLMTFVLPHGIIELSAICIAGGAGLWLGSALLAPGRRTRGEVLVARGREAVSLIGGTAMLLVLAGVIEGFVSPSQLPREIKLAFAAVFATALAAYFLLAGRDEEGTATADEAAGAGPARPGGPT
jgi:uncharacterized membrane protein SpoIIM required for sporulation/uncharacterized RDD family membrane protein YckC